MPHLDTLLAQAGSRWDERTGAISMPVYHSATFRHPGLGRSTGFDYSRTGNPTRRVLEDTLAAADGGLRAFAFASGLAAIDVAMRLFQPGDRILATEDLYGGTYRLFERVYRPWGLDIQYLDTSDLGALDTALAAGPARGIFLDVPSNPLLKVADIRAISERARRVGALTLVDNTFLTPCRMRPLELGADLVLYSGTKYLGGHDDLLAGILVTTRPELADRLGFLQNATGAILGPQESWLLLRGLKTLPLRLARQEANAAQIATWLGGRRRVERVFYPGLPDHPGHGTLAGQASGFGAMLSFTVRDPARVADILGGVRVFMFAESLGGVESLITFPAAQTHVDMPAVLRERLGIHQGLLRLSVGVEALEDLLQDLERVL